MNLNIGVLRKTLLGLVMIGATATGAIAAEPAKGGLEGALQAAMDSKRGVRVYVNGEEIGGAITRIEPGQYIEMRNQEFGRIVVRWDRIDGVAMP
jgi:hypothetical protein